MTPVQVIYYIIFLIVLLPISGAELTRNTKNAPIDLITIGYSWQHGTSDESLHKFVNQFGLYPQKDESQIFRIMTYQMQKWKDLLKSYTDVDTELIFWSQEQTIISIHKTCEEMNLAEFSLLYHIVNTTSNNLLIIDFDSESRDRISILVRIATKCNICAQTAGKVSRTIYFCNEKVSNKWINKLERICQKEHAAMLSLPRNLEDENAIYSWMPRIFASATEHKYHNRFSHSTQQSRTINKVYRDSRSQHMLTRHRRKNRVNARKYKLLKLQREQKNKQKIRKKASDVLEIPIKRRKLLCKYRKSCYETGIIPNTWNIYNILPTFMGLHEAQNNFSEKESMTEMHIKNENEEKEEINEVDLKLLCRYRKSCYKEVGAEIEKDTLKVQAGLSTKELASMALAKVEEKERIAALRFVPKKVITDKNLNKTEEKMKKRLTCKYRKSCYESGIRPEIDVQFGNLYQKIHYFLSHETDKQKIIHKEFNNFSDDEKRIYCKYRKSCYITGQKPVINYGQNFKYMHIVKKQEKVIPLELSCKYRKSCYETGILPDLKKKVAEKETSPMVPKQTVISLQHLKIFCKYRKSCYKRKAEEEQNLNVGLIDEAKTLDNNGIAEKKENEKRKKKIIESFQKKTAFKSEKIEESNVLEKTEHAFETKPIKEINDKKLIKKSKVSIPEKEKRMTATIENEEFKETIYKPKKKKTKEPVEEIRTGPAKKVLKTTLPTTIKKQLIREKKVPEHAESKKQRLKVEKIAKEIKSERIKDEEITKEKEVLVTEEKDFEKESLPIKVPIKEVQSVPLPDENTSPKEVNIYENLSPLTLKLLCKYRKSCYENGKLPPTQVSKEIQDFQEKKEDFKLLELRCKYRKSCYETGKLPENLHENLKIMHSTKKKEEDIPLTLKCKYRKSCYETGKLPLIEKSIFRFPTVQILDEHKGKQFVEKEVNRKLRCKYRKSCYVSGKLPPYLNHTVYVLDTSIKQDENPQLKCKYRKSCYESMGLDIQLNKVRKMEEQKKIQEGVVKPPYRRKSVIKHKEKEQKDEVLEEVIDEKSKRTGKKKSKELTLEAKEQEYLQIKPLESQSRTVTKPRLLNNSQKLKCKYRLKCYDGIPHQITEEKRQLSIKDFRRANGAICSIYYISCRKQAGLPIIERAPIGPNGRRLCRKKKKEEITN
ncbi:unnamed protein product [Onchocerca flexuosa]|uniref:Ig-like domain-containing protein n=1 Tax=Onchocerca flexuosa TaxID=387005 RepID=A0A183GYD7_9BILA|nr:unnamed protein product [Onchocerca flexuosa]